MDVNLCFTRVLFATRIFNMFGSSKTLPKFLDHRGAINVEIVDYLQLSFDIFSSDATTPLLRYHLISYVFTLLWIEVLKVHYMLDIPLFTLHIS